MSLFRNENPALGPSTTVQELAGYGAGNPVASNFKPTTRETLQVYVPTTAASSGTYFFQAPWACQVVAIHFNCSVISTGAATGLIEKITADAVAPAASGTSIAGLHTALDIHGATVNTRVNITLTSTAASLLMNAGDQLALFTSASTAGISGYFQVEVVQIG